MKVSGKSSNNSRIFLSGEGVSNDVDDSQVGDADNSQVGSADTPQSGGAEIKNLMVNRQVFVKLLVC